MLSARTWGSTETERRLAFPCDAHLEDADEALYRAVSVDASPSVVFRWLCQLRAAPYSYDLLDNLGRRSPQELTPGLEKLSVGQPVMTIFDLVAFEQDRHLTLLLARARRLFGDVAITYLVVPQAAGRVRLVVKLRVRYPRTRVGASLVRRALPWGDLFMMRRQLLNLKRLAERGGRECS